MVWRDDHLMNHPDDHIRHNDEAFQYQGTLPTELVTKFVNENQPQIALLQGFIAVGKTRTSKEFARLLAELFRGQRNRAKVHTFLFDLRGKSVETLLSDILRAFKDKVQGWNYGNIENIEDVDQISIAFGKETNQVFILVLDNVDRVHDKERPKVLEFIQELVSRTDNVYLVVTSRTDVNLVRIPTKVMKHHMKPLEQKYAKELLKETSGNPEGFDKYADNIIHLMGGLPFSLIIAGNEMNKKSSQLPYTPKEFVDVITNSTSLSLDLENIPTEDKIISRVTDIVKGNWNVLENVVVALDYPQMFDTEELKDAMVATSGSSECDWQIKQTMMLLLRRSVYTLNEGRGSAVSLESAPLLIEVLKETFCQMTSKDGFLKDFNKCLVNMLDDTSYLMRSGAKELRQAELHLLRNQKGPKVTPQEVQELRTNVITKAYEFLGTVEVDAKMCTNFQTQCIQIQNEWERAEAQKAQGQAVSPDSSCNGKTVVTEESSASDVKVTQDNNMSTVFQSPRNDDTKSVPSNVFTDDSSISIDLCKTKSMSLNGPILPVPGSLHSTDCRKPTQESLSSHVTYSAYPQDPRFPAHYNPVLDQNTSFPPPMDRRYVYGNQGVREQYQMLPGPFLPPNVQGGSYYDPRCKGGSVPYNQFESTMISIIKSCTTTAQAIPLHPNSQRSLTNYSQAHQPAFLSDGSYPSSDCPPQGPVYGYPQAHGPPFQSHVSTPPPRLQTQSSSNRFCQECGPPQHNNVSSPTSSFLPQGPSCKYPQAYVPPFPDHGSTPSFQAQSFSDRFSQAQGPPLQSNVSSPSSSFRPRGPQSLNAPSLPGSLRTNGFYSPPNHMNGPPNRPYQRDYGHDRYGQYQQQPRYGHQRYCHFY